MKISKNKFLIYLLTLIIVFQDSITNLFHLSFFDYFDEFLILFFVFRAMIYLLKHRYIPPIVIRLFILVSIFWVIGVSSCLINSSYTTSSLLMASILMIKIFFLIMSFIIYPIKRINYGYFIDALLFVGKICAFTGIINFIVPSLWSSIIPYAYDYIREGLPSVMGLFIHAGQYGWFMLLVGIIYYSKYRAFKDKKYLYRFVIYAGLACLSIKTKVVVGIASVILFDSLVLQKRKIDAKKIAIPMIGVGFITFAFGGLINETYIKYFTDQGGSARYAFLRESLSIISDFFPIGTGFSKFGTYYAQINYSEWYYTYGLNTVYGLRPGNMFFGTDAFWPAIMGETGLVGTLIYFFILLLILKSLFNGYKKMDRFEDNNYLFVVLSSLLIFIQAIVESSGEQIFNSSPQNIIIGIMIGFALSSTSRRGIMNDRK